MRHTFDLDGESRSLWLSRREGGFDLHLAGGWSGPVALAADLAGAGTLTIAGSSEPVVYVVDGDTVHVHLRGQAWSLRYIDPEIDLRLLAVAALATGPVRDAAEAVPALHAALGNWRN